MIEASKIVDGLYQGSKPPPGRYVSSAGFNVLVLAAYELKSVQRPEWFEGVKVIPAGIDDCNLNNSILATANSAAQIGVGHLRKGKNVLVTCNMGRNRSGLIVGLILYKLTGMSGEDIVRVIKARRRSALTNQSFCSYLEELPRTR